MIRLLFFFCIIMSLSGASTAKDESLKIVMAQDHISHQLGSAVLKEAFARVGKSAKFVTRPNRRALLEANDGLFDGEVGRIAGIEGKFPNLIQLSTSVVNIEGVTLSKRADLKIDNWDDLKQYRVGVIRGEVYAEKGAAGYIDAYANDYEQLLSLLNYDRIDVAVGIKNDALFQIGKQQMSDIKIGTVLFSAPLYPLLYKSNRHIVGQLEIILKAMQSSGEISLIHSRYMQKTISKIE